MADQVTIGSSDVAAILGVKGSPWEAWPRLVGLVPRYSDTDTAATARGRMLEPAIGMRYAVERGLVVGRDMFPGPPIGQPPIVRHDRPWMAARPDFLVHVDGAHRIVEAKTARYLDAEIGWGAEGTDEIPPGYLVQVVWQMAVTGIERVDVAAFGVAWDDWRVYTVTRNPRIERGIVERVAAWYERHVVAGDPPALDGSDGCLRGLAAMHRQVDRDRWVQATEDDVAVADELAARKRAIAEHEEVAARCEAYLKRRIAGAHGIRAGERPLATWGERRGATRIDLRRLRAERPDIAQAYAEQGEASRTFRLEMKEQAS